MAAAWQLAKQPGYEIHVYEKSWRLGGKGASVRDNDGRILDHGLHVWLGFYENAFRMMRECYAEVEKHNLKPLTHGSIDEAFFPEPHIGVVPPNPYGDLAAWSGYFPPTKGLPGTDLDEGSNPFTLASYLQRCFDLLKTLILSAIGTPEEDKPGGLRPHRRSTHDEAVDLDFSVDTTRSLQLLIERAAKVLRVGSLTGAAVLLQSVTILERWLQKLDDFAPQNANSALKLMEALAAQTRKALHDITSIDPQLRAKTEIIDIVLTIMVGLFRDRVLFRNEGLDAINGADYRAWLRQHGATRTSLDSSFLTGIYDLVFAYRDGDRHRPSLAAGVAVRGALRMLFTYRGAMFWRIRSGMGEAVFAPLYKVLMARKATTNKGGGGTSPVHFHFFHELEAVDFDVGKQGTYLSSLRFRTYGDPKELDACSRSALDHYGCWPKEKTHNFKGVYSSSTTTKPLRVEADFDAVIFAVGIDALRQACPPEDRPRADAQLPPRLPRHWDTMFRQVRTVATKSAQVWLDKDLQGLGWYRGPGIFTALEQSYDTWADMSHTLATERDWRRCAPKGAAKAGNIRSASAQSVAYFCGILPEATIGTVRLVARHVAADKRLRELTAIKKVVTAQAMAWDNLDASIEKELKAVLAELKAKPSTAVNVNDLVHRLLNAKLNDDLTSMLTKDLRPVWPQAFRKGTTARASELDRYFQTNFEGSDRYTLSLPGSIVHRISPLDRSVENMTIAGDWTACGLDTGCVEAAVISGMLAAHAISGKPELNSIIGYDHP